MLTYHGATTMMRRHAPFTILLMTTVFACCSVLCHAQEKKVLTVDDYGAWNRIESVTLSGDGNWMSYGYQPNEGDGVLFIRSIDGDQLYEVARGASPRFSMDGQWVAYNIRPSKDKSKKPSKDKKPAKGTLELMDLESGEKTEFKGATSASFSDDSTMVAIRKSKSDSASKSSRADLLVVTLATGEVRNIGNVSSFAFNKTGDLLAYTVAAADRHGNGLYLLQSDLGLLRSLDSANADYSQMQWNKAGDQLAVLRGKDKEEFTQKENDLVVVRDVALRTEEKNIYTPSSDESFPVGMVISELGRLSFSQDNSKVFVGLKEQTAEIEKGDEDRPNVDVWHWNDDRVQSIQMRRAERDRRATKSAVVHLKQARIVQLADELMTRVTIVGKGRWGVGVDDSKYLAEVSWGGSRGDYFRVDLSSGEHKSITNALGRTMGYSPSGEWFLFLKGEQLWAHNLDTGSTTNLSQSTPVGFVNHDDDHPYEKPSYGVAGWTADGTAVIVNHKYDLWLLPLDGSKGTNITAGVGGREQIRFRYTQLDPEEETIDTNKPMLLSAYGEWTKKSGYYTLTVGEEPESLLFDDKSIGRPRKAQKADRVVLTMQTFEDFPNYWATNTRFEAPVQVTDANPQQADFVWGRRILVDYKNKDGVGLQGTLALPGNYEEGKKYPMLVYFYEKMSQRHHQYSTPSFDDRPHMCTYASDGYLVLMPDVIYDIGRPGSSAVDCVTSAVQAVIDLGYADADHIVLQGHSWGGYQSSFILTQTDMFAAVVTGAPVTNLVSFHGELYKSIGSVQQGITEKGQVRMGTSPWGEYGALSQPVAAS